MDKNDSKWWVTLYDPDNRQIGSYHVHGWLKLDAMMLTWALRHSDIEYVTITVENPPDESIDETH